MNTELYIENYRLDISADISALLTFSLGDIKDFSARSTTWSKTIVLPGTSNNNKLFGHIFQVGHMSDPFAGADNVGYDFNASKSADCIIFQDHIQTFKGVLRLLQINITGGRIEYEISVFGKLAGLNVALSSGLLEDLDFSAYDHIFTGENIINSWDNTHGAGYYYPLIDYGTYSTNKHDWDIRTFRPALYAREYIDKMFTVAGFRWDSDLFDSARFKRLIIPHNKKQMTVVASDLLEADLTPVKHFEITNPNTFVKIAFDTVLGSGFTANVAKDIFTYASAISSNIIIPFSFSGEANRSIKIEIWKNDTELVYASATLPENFTLTDTANIPLSAGDTIEFRLTKANLAVFITTTIDLSVGEFSAQTTTPVTIPISVGDEVLMNEHIPKNVRQIDFLVSMVKLFNLYVYEDRFDTSLIYLKPFIEYYSSDTSSSVDWTYKLNRDKVVKIRPMSEINAKIYKFQFKQDNDYYNELYKKRYGQGYGDYIFDSEFEFAEQSKEFHIVFSPTPLVGYQDEDKIYPTIMKRTGPDTAPVEENTDSNIRIMQVKKVTGVELWAMIDGEATSWFLTKYGYAGHFNDPDAPSDDINFGATRELFFTLVTGNLSNTQFNVYWSPYMAEITDPDSKLLSASFYLTPKDIIDLDFSSYVYIDGSVFRLNLIKDYNASRPSDCMIELLKVNHTTYSAAGSGESPPEGCYLLWDTNEILDWDDDEPLLYKECTAAPDEPEPEPDPDLEQSEFDIAVDEVSICSSPTGALLWSEVPWGPGVTMYTDIAGTMPLTGYSFIKPGSTFDYYSLDPVTGIVGSLVGSCP